MKSLILTIAAAAICTASPALAKSTTAKAQIRNASGKVIGSAKAMEHGGQLMIVVVATGLQPGVHGVHLHTTGVCEAPKFESAGPHWNPAMKQHGRDNPMGAHEGDLPNLEVAANGSAKLSFMVPAGKLTGDNGLLDADGSAIVIHAKADDYKTDPSGNSGDRIACGVFARK